MSVHSPSPEHQHIPFDVAVRHWLPIITFCPVNGLPDLIYVTLEFSDTFKELYQLRKDIRRALMWKKMFMEDAARTIADMYPSASTVTVRLMFNRHEVVAFPAGEIPNAHR